MRPLKLVVQGFKPFKDKQEIDFSKLDFFVIKGPTGGGKSSILDAVYFALFGGSLYDLRKQDELINRNAGGFYIDFTFSVGGKVYRIERRKLRNKTGEFRFFENNVRRAIKSDAFKREIKRILGVDAEQFKRIFLLPQGKYSDFLHSAPKDRRKLIVSLLDLSVYDLLTDKLKDRLSEVEKRLANLEGQLQSLGHLTEEELGNLQREIEKLTKLLKVLEEREGKLSEELGKLKNLRGDIERKEHLEGEIRRLGGENYLRLKEKVGRLKPLKGLLPLLQEYLLREGELRELRQREERLKAELQRLKNLLGDLEGERERLEAKKRQISEGETRVETYREVLKRLEVLKQRIETFKAKKAEYLNLQREFEKLKALHSERLREYETAKGGLEELLQRLERLEYSPDREVELSNLLQRCSDRDLLLSRLRSLEEKLRQREERLNKLLREERTLTEKLEGVERKIEEYRKREREYLVYLLIKDLKEGDPCPVCGRPLEEKRAHLPADFDPEGLKRLEEERERLRERLAELGRAISALKAEVENLLNQREELRQTINGYGELPPTEEVEKALNDLRKEKALMEKLERERKERERQLSELERELSTIGGTLKERENRLEVLKGEIQREREELKADLLKLFKTAGLTPPKGQKAVDYLEGELRKRIEDHEREKEVFQNALRELEAKTARLRAKLEERERLLSEVERDIENLKGELKTLRRRMEDGGWKPEMDPRALKEELSRLPHLENELENLERNIAALRAELSNLEMKLKDVDPQEVVQKLQNLERELENLKTQKGETLQRLGKLRGEMEKAKTQMEKRKKLLSQLEETLREKTLLEAVKKDFHSDRLISFVVGRALEDLVALAGEYLFKLSERYLFTLEGDEIKVEDRFFGTVRDIRTLSGGETFLASLSFALAMGDFLGRGASVECLFIDEGFGTLDKDRLERIGELFEKLRHTVDKTVGIITHLDELALRFDQRIEVIPSPEGSRIKVIA